MIILLKNYFDKILISLTLVFLSFNFTNALDREVAVKNISSSTISFIIFDTKKPSKDLIEKNLRSSEKSEYYQRGWQNWTIEAKANNENVNRIDFEVNPCYKVLVEVFLNDQGMPQFNIPESNIEKRTNFSCKFYKKISNGVNIVSQGLSQAKKNIGIGVAKTKRQTEHFLKGIKNVAQTLKIGGVCLVKAVSQKIVGSKALGLLSDCVTELRSKGIEAGYHFVAGITKPIRDILKLALVTVKQAPLTKNTMPLTCYSTDVRQNSNPVSSKEQSFRQKRDKFVKAAQEKILKLNLKSPLMITASGSGGGIRAALGYTGHLLGLKEAALMDTITYASGLSGSTWALSGWLQQNKSIEEFKDFLVNRLTNEKTNILSIKEDKDKVIKLLKGIDKQLIQDIIDNIVVKWTFTEPYTLVDFYGNLLGWLLLSHKEPIQRQYLSKQIEQIKNGQNPMPIYLAQWKSQTNKSIIEFNPYEFGVRDWKVFVPINGFGRRYASGNSENCAPPQSVGFLQGIWGSAFAATVNAIWDAFKEVAPYKDTIEQLISESKEFQFIPGSKILNFAKGIKTSPVASDDYISLIDLGIDWMINPIFGLYRNNTPDIIFMFDYQVQSRDNNFEKIMKIYGNEFNMLNDYAKKHNFSFPKLQICKLAENKKIKDFTVFNDPRYKENSYNSSQPTVLFFPLVDIYDDQYGTFKFNYKSGNNYGDADYLINKTKSSIVNNKKTIENIIKARVKV